MMPMLPLGHHDADAAEQDDVQDRDDGIDLTRILEQPEDEAAGDRAGDTAGDDHGAHLDVDAAAAAVGEHAGNAGAGDLSDGGGDRDRGRNAVEDQDRGGQEAAADPDHAGQQADQAAEADDHQRVYGNARDRQVDVHRSGTVAAKARRRKRRAIA
jgi:hypothetical protein